MGVGRKGGGPGIGHNCQKYKLRVATNGKSKGLCRVCYKKILWKPKSIICERCKKERPMHAKGLCRGCYSSTFHLSQVKIANAKKNHNVSETIYRELMKGCTVCEFDKLLEIHHLDHNHNNHSRDNLISLCPNHHKMIHSLKYQKEIFEILKSKGYNVPKGYEFDGFAAPNQAR